MREEGKTGGRNRRLWTPDRRLWKDHGAGGQSRERLFPALSGEILRVRPCSVQVGPAQVRLLLQFFFLFSIILFKKEIYKNSIRTNFKLKQI
jgi:hypothetical protein